jgi:hypothetical protein
MPNIPALNAVTMKDYQLLQDSWKPVIAFDYFKENSNDTNKVLTVFKNSTLQFKDVGGKKAADFTATNSTVQSTRGVNAINTLSNMYRFRYSGIRRKSIKTYTFMVRPKSSSPFLGEQCLLELFNTANKAKIIFSLRKINTGNQYYFSVYMRGIDIMGSPETGINDAGIGTNLRIPNDQWSHITVTMEEKSNSESNFTNFYFHMNGAYVSQSPFSVNSTQNNSIVRTDLNEMNYTDTFVLGSNLNMSVAWIHMYDYILNLDEIRRDMNYDDPEYIMTPSVTYTPAALIEKCRNIKYGETLTNVVPSGMMQLTQAERSRDAYGCCALCDSRTTCKAFTHVPGIGCSLYSSSTPNTTIGLRDTTTADNASNYDEWAASILRS